MTTVCQVYLLYWLLYHKITQTTALSVQLVDKTIIICFVSLIFSDDHRLPSVPPILVTIPQDYPNDSPECSTSGQEYGSLIF